MTNWQNNIEENTKIVNYCKYFYHKKGIETTCIMNK